MLLRIPQNTDLIMLYSSTNIFSAEADAYYAASLLMTMVNLTLDQGLQTVSITVIHSFARSDKGADSSSIRALT